MYNTVHGGPKNWHNNLYALIFSNINRFSKVSLSESGRKFAIIPSLKILPHLKSIAAIPGEMSLSGANCHSVSLIIPLASGVAALSASSSSKVNTLNI